MFKSRDLAESSGLVGSLMAAVVGAVMEGSGVGQDSTVVVTTRTLVGGLIGAVLKGWR